MNHMTTMPYIDKMGKVYKYGEFYPIELSPFGYNETYAPELELLSQTEAIKRGYKWQDNTQKTTDKETLLPDNIPDSINDVDEKILEEILKCVDCGRNYKITEQELLFYRKLNIPLPRKCFYCRHGERVRRRGPYKFWSRNCAKCQKAITTNYSPDRPEVVYCEKCYQREVY